jgi:uncharacterized OB-fold protein
VSAFEPPLDDDLAAFWDATRRGELVLPWCRACARAFWFPRPVCPGCLGDHIEWRAAQGIGTVYAVSVQHKPGPGRAPDAEPYAVALVDLPEGVRVMANVLECRPDAVSVGMRVRVAWQPLSDGRQLLQFAPE